MKQFLTLTFLIYCFNNIHSQTSVTPLDITNFQTGITQARENDLYLETTNNLYYIGLANGKVKFIQDTIRINSTLIGNGSIGNPIGIAQQSATSGQVLSWNGSAWIPTNAAPATATVSNTITAPNSIRTTVNGVNGVNVNIVTGVSNTSTANTLSTTVNGITGTGVPLINSNTLSSASGNITSTVNGVTSAATALSGITTTNLSSSAGIVNTQLANSTITVNGTSIELGGSGTVTASPSGSAGGDLSGTYPNPTIGTGKVTSTHILDGTVGNSDLVTMAANTVKSNATAATASATDLAITTNSLLGRGAGNITPITLGTGLSISGSTLNSSVGTVTSVTGTLPISVASGTTTPVISIATANTTTTGALSSTNWNTFNNKIGTVTATTADAVVTSGTLATIQNTLSRWNANQLQGYGILSTAPTMGQLLSYNGSNWAPSNANLNWLVQGNDNAVYNTNFLGTTNDVPMTIRSNNTAMFEAGRRQTLGLYDSSSTGLFPYNQQDASVSYIRGTGGNSALQFEASGASFYKPIFFTDSDGNFQMRGSCASTDFFELGSAGSANDGRLLFTIGDDGEEPMIFRKYNYTTSGYVEMLRMQGTGLNDIVRVGVNTGGNTANSTFEVVGSITNSIVSTSSALTLTELHHTVIVTANVNITLPAASTCIGRKYIIKKTNNNNSTITSYVNTDASNSTTLARGVYHLQSDGTNWQRIN